MHVIYTGKRVRLRPFKDEDEFAGLFDEIMATPNDHWGPGWWPSAERKKDFAPAGMLDPGKYSQFAIERLDTSELVGFEEHGEMLPGSIQAWLGTDILREHWHRGFGIEAKLLMLCYLFENFPLTTVHAGTLEHHLRARAGLEACGMCHGGCLSRFHHDSGRFYDVVHYQIFREEWERLPTRGIIKRG